MRARWMILAAAVGLLAACVQAPPETAGPSSGMPAVTDIEGGEPLPPRATEIEGWERLPQAPLAARHGAVGVWVAETFVVLGGRDTPACPPGASCVAPAAPALADGARFDPSTGTWTRIADAPVPVESAATAVLGECVYMWLPGGEGLQRPEPVFLAYRADTDEWEQLPLPPDAPAHLSLTTAGDLLVGYRATHEHDGGQHADLVFDPAQGQWRTLPSDPLAPSFDRTMVWTPEGLVLLAVDLDQRNTPEPSLYRAAVLDLGLRRWRGLPDSEVLTGGYPLWFAVENRVINPTVGTADGGEDNPWDRPYPSGGVLDLEGEAWSALPPSPEPELNLHYIPAAADSGLLVSGGYAFEPESGRWHRLTLPNRAGEEGQAAAVGTGRYYLWGGVRWSADGRLTNQGWSWTGPR